MNIPGFAAMLKRASTGTLLAATLTGGGFALADEAWNAFPDTTATQVAYPASAAGAGAYGLAELGAAAAAKRRRRLERAKTALARKQASDLRAIGTQLESRLLNAGLKREAESFNELVTLNSADPLQDLDAMREIISLTRAHLDEAALSEMDNGPGLSPQQRATFLKALNVARPSRSGMPTPAPSAPSR